MRQDRAAILAHNRKLSAQILAGVDALGLPLASPRDEAQRGGSIMLRLPQTVAAANVLGAFRQASIYADARGQVLRLSPGVMTTQDGVARMLGALGAAL
jgi:selenocysteine lyase/cysteine desulfurase